MSFFGKKIKELRGAESQAVFAAKIGLKQSAYARYEKGNREPDLDTLCMIARTLGVTTDFLLDMNNGNTLCHGAETKVQKKSGT